MPGVGALPPPPTPPLALKRATITNTIFLIQGQTHKTKLTLFPKEVTPFYPLLLLGRTGSPLFAKKKHKGSSFDGIVVDKDAYFEEEEEFKGRNGSSLFVQKKHQGSSFDGIVVEKEAFFEEEEFEIEGFDDDEYDDDDDDDYEDEDDDFDDDDEEFEVEGFDEEFEAEGFEEEEVKDVLDKKKVFIRRKVSDGDDKDEDKEEVADNSFVPFPFLLKKKPRGFGEGKVYDTSIEDKLLEEIEQSRKAQLANVNKLKNDTKLPTSKRELKAPESSPSGIRVRINNLPKKKNIQRDLKSAFQGVRGVLNISPAVSGNKKTREPVCKGFGFVDFRSLEDANRFVQMFSDQTLTFGKVEKRVKCEILKPLGPDNEGSANNGYSTSESRSTYSEEEDDQDSDAEQDDPTMEILVDDYSDEEPDDEDIIDILESLSESEQGDYTEVKKKSTTDSSSKQPKDKTKAAKKKSAAVKKPNKNPKLNIPGSAKKLKVREKAKLADVFSRYGSKGALVSKEK